jgi:hypothetical protein
MTTTKKTELLAYHTWTGAYGMAAEAGLVRRGDGHYLFIDHFSGNDLEGRCMRLHVHGVPAGMVADVLDALTDPDGDAGCVSPTSKFNWLLAVGLAGLQSIGRVSSLPWTGGMWQEATE